MAGPALMSISAVPSLIMLTNKCYFLSKKKKKKSTVLEMKNILDGINIRLDIRKEKINLKA